MRKTMMRITYLGMAVGFLVVWTGPSYGQSQPASAVTPTAPTAALSPAPPPGLAGDPLAPVAIPAPSGSPSDYTYNPSGRRDPFAAILKETRPDDDNHVPPLQRLSLTELSLIGIVWGGFGYSAMVQAPDGRGYTVRQGTRIGPNSGIVSSITENAVVVHERFTDVFGNKQVREYVKLLHAKEGSE